MIFISYSRSDREFALRLASDLREHGADVWIDQDIPSGKRWDSVVEEALKAADQFLVILTPKAMESRHVRDEVGFALDEEKPVTPILLQHFQLPYRLRQLQYGDFTQHYARGLAQLLRDLDLKDSTEDISRAELVANHPLQEDQVKPSAERAQKKRWIVAAPAFGLAAITLAIFFGYYSRGSQETRPLPSEPVFLSDQLDDSLQGVWQEVQGPDVIRIEPNQVSEFNGNSLVVRGFVGRSGDRLILRHTGLREEWRASVQGSALRLEHEGRSSAYHRLNQLPSQFDLTPFPVAAAHQLSSSRIQEIQHEIKVRFENDQAQLKQQSRDDEGTQRRRDNLTYLCGLLAEVGWIDSDRFGHDTSAHTVLLARQTEDLRLMRTVLPFANTELKKSGKGQLYAILYDRLELELGHKQLYGTQLMEDKKGPYILPLAEPTNVDKNLADLGLPPLQSYIAKVSKNLYNDRQVRIADDP